VTTAQVSLLYVQLYIPFVAVFWLTFGNKEVLDEIAHVTIHKNTDHWKRIQNDTNSLVGLNNMVTTY